MHSGSFLRQPQAAQPLIDVDNLGFSYAGEPPWRATWRDVKRITAYKIDRLMVDEIRVDVALQDGITGGATEECSGFEGLMLELERRFPSASGWRRRIRTRRFSGMR
jgi:hypothetical protein